jgi:hypothetical protein
MKLEAQNIDEIQKQPLLIADVISRLSLHVHEDIEEGAKWFKIPIALWNTECVYIMQEERCVFAGTRKDARSFYEKNYGEYCRSRFPL